jgi:hypothetical protein
MTKKFVLIIAAFTITVPGFFLFSYWFLGIFSGMTTSAIRDFHLTFYAGRHYGDYNKTGEEVVKTRRLLLSHGLPCKPVLVYFDNAINVGKPYLKSAGGCENNSELPKKVLDLLAAAKIEKMTVDISTGYKLSTYAQTAVALRKSWTELARLSDAGVELTFPMVQLVHENGDNEFIIASKTKR